MCSIKDIPFTKEGQMLVIAITKLRAHEGHETLSDTIKKLEKERSRYYGKLDKKRIK